MPSTLSILTSTFTEARERAGPSESGRAPQDLACSWSRGRRLAARSLLVGLSIPRQCAHRCGRTVAASGSCPTRRTLTQASDRSAPPLHRGNGIVVVGDHRGTRPLLDLAAHPRAVAAAVVVLAAFMTWESTRRTQCSKSRSSRRVVSQQQWVPWGSSCRVDGRPLLSPSTSNSPRLHAFQTGLRIAPIAAVLLVVAPSRAWWTT